MDNFKPTATLYHDTRRSKKKGTFPVKITIYFDGHKKRYKTGVDISVEDWERLYQQNLRDEQLKITKRRLQAHMKKAEDILTRIESFSFEVFEDLYSESRRIPKSYTLKERFDEYIKKLEENDQIGTAMSYKCTINSLLSYKKGLRLGDLSTTFLREYERYMLKKNLSPSTVGIYLRQLRRIINLAIQEGRFPAEKYPFRGYTIPSSRNIKKSLTEKQISLLLDYNTDGLNKRKALAFWLYSYLCNGINMSDICLLKRNQIDKDFFYYFRAKTKNTKKKELRPIKVPLTERAKDVMRAWGNPDSKSEYVFPILKEGLTAKQIKFRIIDFISFVNKYMKEVAIEVGIDVQVGTYVARHTHSTILKRKGVPTEFIKENLGHSSILTTEAYLADFTDDMKIKYAQFLLPTVNVK